MTNPHDEYHKLVRMMHDKLSGIRMPRHWSGRKWKLWLHRAWMR